MSQNQSLTTTSPQESHVQKTALIFVSGPVIPLFKPDIVKKAAHSRKYQLQGLNGPAV
jgi:hypothetical protein